jgi:hypothetical protein
MSVAAVATPDPVYPDRVVNLCPPDAVAYGVLLRLPDTPGVEWLVFAVPASTEMLDDEGITARQVSLEVAAEARSAAERITYDAVLERRRG